MAKRKLPNETVNVTAEDVSVSGGATLGVDRSKGKKISGAGDLTTPTGFLTFAIKRLPILVWAVGVGAILAIVAIVSLWNVPAGGLVLGSIGLLVGMFGLLVFAALLKPAPKNVKPPVISQVSLWAFGLLLIASGFFSASSVFFDWPIPLRSQMFPRSLRSEDAAARAGHQSAPVSDTGFPC